MESTSFSSIKKTEKDNKNIYSTKLNEDTIHLPDKNEGNFNKGYFNSNVCLRNAIKNSIFSIGVLKHN